MNIIEKIKLAGLENGLTFHISGDKKTRIKFSKNNAFKILSLAKGSPSVFNNLCTYLIQNKKECKYSNLLNLGSYTATFNEGNFKVIIEKQTNGYHSISFYKINKNKVENLKENQTLINRFIDGQANELVKQFVKEIKNSLPGARLMVQGIEINTLKEFGNEIIKRDALQVGTVTFYAGFEKNYYGSIMSISEIEENLKSKELKFLNVRYTGAEGAL